MAEKKVKGLQMRKNGASYEVIASTLGWNSPQAAHDAISRALMEMVREPAEEVIRLELRRLDELFIKPFEAAARQGDLQSLAGVMNIMNRRAKLLGLDAPEKKELTGADGKDLLLPPTTIIINGPAEEGEPVVMGESIVEQTQ